MEDIFASTQPNVTADSYDITVHEACNTDLGSALDISLNESDDQIIDKLGGAIGY